MVCSCCGAERPDGDRFCGMCGTPLPHRPLSAAGAEGTISLSQGPLGTPSSHERMPTAVVGLLDLLGHSGVSLASEETRSGTSAPDAAVSQIAGSLPADLPEPDSRVVGIPPNVPPFPAESISREEPASEEWLNELPGGVHHASATHPEEPSTTEVTPPSQPGVSKFLDALAATPAEPSEPGEAPHFPWMDDVLDEIEHVAAKTSAVPDERPRFLDLLGDLPQPELGRDTPEAAVAAGSFSEASGSPVASKVSRAPVMGAKRLSRKQRVWIATAAVLVFVALAVVQWRNQFADNSKRLEQRFTDKILELAARDDADADKNQPAASADPVDRNPPPSQSQPSSNPPQESAAANQGGQTPAPTSANAAGPANTATQGQPPKIVPDKPAPPRLTSPGAQEMMRAEEAKTAAARSEWLWKATAKGNPDAPVQLADLYVAGNGVPRSCEQAIVLLKTAALGNNARACNRLASMYTTGTCVPRSQLEAYRWLSSALTADPNNQYAQHDRDTLLQQMTPEERALAQGSR